MMVPAEHWIALEYAQQISTGNALSRATEHPPKSRAWKFATHHLESTPRRISFLRCDVFGCLIVWGDLVYIWFRILKPYGFMVIHSSTVGQIIPEGDRKDFSLTFGRTICQPSHYFIPWVINSLCRTQSPCICSLSITAWISTAASGFEEFFVRIIETKSSMQRPV